MKSNEKGKEHMNLKKRLQLAGSNLLNCLCPDKNYLPYWHMAVDENRLAEYQFRPHCNGHNVGRWWNTMLRLEDAIGFDIPDPIEQAMLENTWRMCDNPTGILLDDPLPNKARSWYIHSYRETMLALGLLVKYRNSDKARQQGLRAIECMRAATSELPVWDISAWGAGQKVRPYGECYTHGRAIEGLLCFYSATQEQAAIDEAARLAAYHLEYSLNTDGTRSDGSGGHMHSYLNTLRGLVMYTAINEQQDHLQSLMATYNGALAKELTPSGFITHNIDEGPEGDIASAGDIAHIALLLWDSFKDPSLLDDVERIARCRLLPAQVLEPMPVRPRRNDLGDSFRELPERFVGAIGGSVGQVQGQSCVTDFSAAAAHSLIEIYQNAVCIDDDAIRVKFHFDCERDGIRIESQRDTKEARVTVLNSTGKDLLIRVPGWAPRSSVHIEVNGESSTPDIDKGFALIKAQGKGELKAVLSFALPESQTTEPWREPPEDQQTLTFHWLGDEITDVEPCGNYLRPFPKPVTSILDI